VEDPTAPTLTQFLDLMNWFANYEGEANRNSAAEALGQLAVYYYSSRKLQLDILTGRDPMDIMEDLLARGLERLGSQGAIEHLLDAYRISKRPRIKQIIDEFDSSLLEEEQRKKQQVEQARLALEREANRLEASRIISRLKDPNLSQYELSEYMKRISLIGGSQDVPAIIARLESGDVPSVVRQNALKALGNLGGPEAREFLVEQLLQPLPREAKLSDYGDTQAILRSQAALALGKCADESAIKLLTDIANDDGQYNRVREACRKAIGIINRRYAPVKE
jgi:hypothetical protein